MGLSPSRLNSSIALLQAAAQGNGQSSRQGNLLLIKHPSLAWPAAESVGRDQKSFGQALHLSMGSGVERYSGLHTRTDALPFIDAAFRQVVLWHVIATGREAELEEACRVLQPDGELLVLGLNQMAIGARFDRTADRLPRLHRLRLHEQLLELDMEVTGAWGAGLAGITSTIFSQDGWAGLLLPFSDQVLLRVQHVHPAGLSPLRMERFQSGVAPSS